MAMSLGEERLDADEPDLIKRIVRANLLTLKTREKPVVRGQHPKHHGCVNAVLIVEPNLPAHLQAGVFASPAKYDALIRFSNGRRRWDFMRDAHGMAIKLLNVPGPKLLEGHEKETAQDFVLLDHEVFFMARLDEYADFNERVAKARKGFPHSLLFVARLALFHRPLSKRVKAFAGQKPGSLLASYYWSTTPYRLGSQAVKYMAKPTPMARPSRRSWSLKNRLSKALVADLATDEVRFDFGVHVQTNATDHPIEDPTVNWSSNGANFVKLATIFIPRQVVDPKAKLAENLAFSPWHTLEAHRPLGAINRSRRDVYIAMASARHRENHVGPAGSSEKPAA